MPSEIYLVKVGMTMTEGVVDEWYIQDGGSVKIGEPIYRLETEKVNMDVEAEADGIVKHLEPAGKTLEPGDVVGWLYATSEPIPEVLPTATRKTDLEATETVTNEADKGHSIKSKNAPTSSTQGKEVSKKIAVVPAARRLARELDVDLSAIEGTGPRGRITKEDVEKAASEEPSLATGVPMSGMRKTIAERMFSSLQQTAQLTISMEVSMDAAIGFRAQVNELWQSSEIRLSYTDMVLKATADALLDHPRLNSSLVGDTIQILESVHLGFAVALEEGLIVPVIKLASEKSLRQISVEANQLTNRAKSNQLKIDDVSDGSFTVTSLGMFGVDMFTPILNSPQCGILGVGRIYEKVVWEESQPTKGHALTLSLTWDHRLIDGAPAAQFLADVKLRLERPVTLISDNLDN